MDGAQILLLNPSMHSDQNGNKVAMPTKLATTMITKTVIGKSFGGVPNIYRDCKMTSRLYVVQYFTWIVCAFYKSSVCPIISFHPETISIRKEA